MIRFLFLQMHIYSFEKLEVWQDSRNLVRQIYAITAKFPIEEKFGIISQVRRSAVSVSCNISEGSGRRSKKDQAQFYRIAFGSTLETLNLLILSADLEFISIDQLKEMRILIEKISNKLNRLIESLSKQINE